MVSSYSNIKFNKNLIYEFRLILKNIGLGPAISLHFIEYCSYDNEGLDFHVLQLQESKSFRVRIDVAEFEKAKELDLIHGKVIIGFSDLIGNEYEQRAEIVVNLTTSLNVLQERFQEYGQPLDYEDADVILMGQGDPKLINESNN